MKLVDEKACRFQAEYDRVAKRLDEALQSNSECKTQLGESLEQLKVAKEDLDVTRNNYEKQLQLLTEHFVKLNEQVSKQEEQLSRLKSHKVRRTVEASCPTNPFTEPIHLVLPSCVRVGKLWQVWHMEHGPVAAHRWLGR